MRRFFVALDTGSPTEPNGNDLADDLYVHVGEVVAANAESVRTTDDEVFEFTREEVGIPTDVPVARHTDTFKVLVHYPSDLTVRLDYDTVVDSLAVSLVRETADGVAGALEAEFTAALPMPHQRV